MSNENASDQPLDSLAFNPFSFLLVTLSIKVVSYSVLLAGLPRTIIFPAVWPSE